MCTTFDEDNWGETRAAKNRHPKLLVSWPLKSTMHLFWGITQVLCYLATGLHRETWAHFAIANCFSWSKLQGYQALPFTLSTHHRFSLCMKFGPRTVVLVSKLCFWLFWLKKIRCHASEQANQWVRLRNRPTAWRSHYYYYVHSDVVDSVEGRVAVSTEQSTEFRNSALLFRKNSHWLWCAIL